MRDAERSPGIRSISRLVDSVKSEKCLQSGGRAILRHELLNKGNGETSGRGRNACLDF